MTKLGNCKLNFTKTFFFLNLIYDSVELRELEAKLKAGYMNKERAAQMAEKDVLIEKDKQYEAIMAAMMKKEYEKATELEIEKEQEKYEHSVEYQEQLQKQLQEKVVMATTHVPYCHSISTVVHVSIIYRYLFLLHVHVFNH